MTNYSLPDLLSARDGIRPPQWEGKVSLIREVRSEIEQFLENGGHAYGFSTFLGHLDRHPVDARQSQQILQAHIVGVGSIVDAATIRSISVMKICQLTQGLSGISEERYSALVSSFGQEKDSHLDFDASYGSGDVVCASWWVKAVLGDFEEYQAGDVIALINGHFIVPGLLLHHRSVFRDLFLKAIHLVERVRSTVPEEQGVQLPVSLRDLTPFRRYMEGILREFDETLVACANEGSGNPLFIYGANGVEAVSNSSFLGFGVSGMICQLGDLARLASAYLRSATLSLSRLKEAEATSPLEAAYFVQFPKVSKAYLDQVSDILSDSITYAQTESEGIEDIGDGALIRFNAVRRASRLVGKQIVILENLLSSPRDSA